MFDFDKNQAVVYGPTMRYRELCRSMETGILCDPNQILMDDE